MRRDERGVTLTEILVMLALLALLSLISIPSMIGVLRAFEVRGASSALAAGFRRAQGLALQEHKNFIVVVKPVENSTSPNFCWPVPGGKRIYAIVEDDPSDALCKVTACPSGAKLREWGPELPKTVSYIAEPGSQEPLDIGGASGSDTYATLCFTSRGYIHKDTAERTGVYVGNSQRGFYRKVSVNLTGRISLQRYIGGAYREQ